MTTVGKVLIGVGIGGVALLALGYVTWRGVNDGGLAEQKRRAVALGMPTDPNGANPKSTPENNAAPQLLAIGKELSEWRDKDGKDFSSTWQTVSNADLIKFQPLVRKAIEASKKPELVFGYDYNKGPYLLVPEYVPARTVVRLLCSDSIRLATAGNERGAFERILAAARISCLIGKSEPMLISLLVQISTSQVVIRTGQRAVTESKHSETSLRSLEMMLDELGPIPNFRRAMVGEYAGWISFAERMKMTEIETVAKLSTSEKSVNVSDLEVAWMIPSQRNQLLAGLNKRFLDYFEKLPEDLEGQAKAYQVSKEFDRSIEADKTTSGKLATILTAILAPAHAAQTRELAMRRSVRCLAVALRTNAKSLPDLGKDSIDPFTNEPLKFLRRNGEVRIYSVGDNLKDDGGDSKNRLDAVVRYPIHAAPPKT